jgi:hypothetical protein
MSNFKFFLINILNKKKQWLPAVLIIIIIFIILVFVGMDNPILFFYS